MRLGLLTSTRFASYYEDETHLVNALRERKVHVEPVVWTDGRRLDDFDAIVMRTPWDWFSHRERFRAFLSSLREVKARVFNAPELMMQFADKRYLTQLASQGVAVIPTQQLEQRELGSVAERLAKLNWSRAVLKPAFTANAVGARLFDANDAATAVTELTPLPEGEPWLLQPFVPAIAGGERSFVFFDGQFSHGVLKQPKAGEWRVQHDYGGVVTAWSPSRREIDEATALLAKSAPGTLYARVDAVPFEGRLHLMELEVVEPELFFRVDERAPGRFIDALMKQLG
ncbi:MAG: ATP-grasp domain-containing protein [Archangium sp.]